MRRQGFLLLLLAAMLFEPDKTLQLCVTAPAHDLLEYRVDFEKTPMRDTNGSRFLDLYLRER